MTKFICSERYLPLAGREENLPDLIADAKIGFDKSYTSKNWPRRSSNLTANDRAVSKFIRMVLNENENNRTPVQDALLAGLTKNAEGFAKPLVESDPHNPPYGRLTQPGG